MTMLAVRDIPVSIKCAGTVNGTIPAGISTFFLNATHIVLGCWVKPTTTFNGVDWRDFMSFRGDSGSFVFAGLFVNNVSNQFAVAGLGAGSAVAEARLNSWQHVVAEIKIDVPRIRLWIDGVLAFNHVPTFTRNLAAVTSISSYLGDNTSSGFAGHIADAFIINKEEEITQAEIDAIYEKGMFPKNKHLFHWPIRGAIGTSVPCEDGNNNENFHYPQNLFNAVLNSSTMYSRDTPMTGRMVDRDAGHCIFTSGTAGYYRHNTDRPYNELTGKRYVGASIWAQRHGSVVTGSGQYCFIMQTTAANAAILITANSSGVIEFGGRSDNADSYNNAISGSFAAKFMVNEWVKLDLIFDYQAKLIQGYVNGVLAAVNAATNWVQNTFQVTRGAQEIQLGHNSLFWPGKLDDFMLFHLTGIPTGQEMRDWYLANKIPRQIKPVIFIDCNDFGPNLVDKSGNDCTFTPISITVPYGLNHISYMG